MKKSFFEVLFIFLKLGLISFGGPVAHLGFFRSELVEKRKWVTEGQYADVIALCQFLPGPASSQVGITLGFFRGGWVGGVAAWLGFTLPSALVLILCAYGFSRYAGGVEPGWMVGLKVAAVAVVAHALWGMAVKLCPDTVRRVMAFMAAAILVLATSPLVQLGVIIAGGIGGVFLLKKDWQDVNGNGEAQAFPWIPDWRISTVCLIAFFILLLGLPVLARMTDQFSVDLIGAFYRSGALVFGGGHVVLPLLEAEVVRPGWVDAQPFLVGYGVAQAVPGPLFTFSAFLGASLDSSFWNGPAWVGGCVCLAAIFLPSWLLVPGALPFWDRFRRMPGARGALAGANAVVVGLLLAALYNPVWTKGIHGAGGFSLALICFFLLAVLKLPAWAVVLFAAVGGGVFL